MRTNPGAVERRISEAILGYQNLLQLKIVSRAKLECLRIKNVCARGHDSVGKGIRPQRRSLN